MPCVPDCNLADNNPVPDSIDVASHSSVLEFWAMSLILLSSSTRVAIGLLAHVCSLMEANVAFYLVEAMKTLYGKLLISPFTHNVVREGMATRADMTVKEKKRG